MSAVVMAVAADEPAPEFDESIARLMAAALLRKGRTSASVREFAAARPGFSYMWGPVASAMDAA
jgi:hypothetical protein